MPKKNLVRFDEVEYEIEPEDEPEDEPSGEQNVGQEVGQEVEYEIQQEVPPYYIEARTSRELEQMYQEEKCCIIM